MHGERDTLDTLLKQEVNKEITANALASSNRKCTFDITNKGDIQYDNLRVHPLHIHSLEM